jgi:hypothetical protein
MAECRFFDCRLAMEIGHCGLPVPIADGDWRLRTCEAMPTINDNRQSKIPIANLKSQSPIRQSQSAIANRKICNRQSSIGNAVVESRA